MNTNRFSVSAIAMIAILAGPLESHAEDAKPVTATEGATTRDGMKSALKQPLNDLNLLQSEIPTVLREARSVAYARPSEVVTCDILIAEVRKLDAELDEDLDQQTIEASFKEKATGKALDAMRGAASSFIPYRGAVRFVSGAQKHDRLVAEARRAGDIRRAYLKGLGESMDCPNPGSPRRVQATAAASPSDTAE